MNIPAEYSGERRGEQRRTAYPLLYEMDILDCHFMFGRCCIFCYPRIWSLSVTIFWNYMNFFKELCLLNDWQVAQDHNGVVLLLVMHGNARVPRNSAHAEALHRFLYGCFSWSWWSVLHKLHPPVLWDNSPASPQGTEQRKQNEANNHHSEHFAKK